jgi:Flp pilus assembly protein TadG
MLYAYAHYRGNARHRRGVAIVYMVIMFFVLMLFLAFGLDYGRVVLVSQELQNASDASALAGALYVQTSQSTALSQAQLTAQKNTAEGVAISVPAGDVFFGYWNRTAKTFDSSGTYSPNAVKVYASRMSGKNGSLPFLFPNLVPGVSGSEVQRSAIAMLGDKNIGVLVMNKKNPSSLNFTGSGSRPKIEVQIMDSNGKITGEYGSVVVNSNSPNGFSWSGNPTMEVRDLYLGSDQGNAQNTLPTDGNLHLNQSPTPDPLAPYYSGIPAKPAKTVTKADASGTWPAGYHPSGLPDGAKLASGIHWVDGSVGGVDGTSGVLLFVNTGDVSLGGNSVLKINKMSGNQWSDLGISLWIYTGNLTMGGTSDIVNNGILYLTGQAVDGGGNVSIKGTPSSIGSMLITDTLNITGNSQINVVHGPGNPKLESVFLVQ